MADYIRRDIVLQIINTVHETGGFAGYADYCTLFDEIDTMPAADVQPVKRGKWEICSDGYYPYCSECKAEPESGKMTNYCPHCGADMREADATKG